MNYVAWIRCNRIVIDLFGVTARGEEKWEYDDYDTAPGMVAGLRRDIATRLAEGRAVGVDVSHLDEMIDRVMA